MNRIYLIGYMGSGKSTIGKALALKLGWSFIDLDELITFRSGRSVPILFKVYGEDAFRQLEASALYSTYQKDNVVIATGGGTPCFFENHSDMKKNGNTFYLDTPVRELMNRVKKDQNIRPLLKSQNDEELIETIEKHLASRIKYYKAADYIINADGEVDLIVKDILSRLKGHIQATQ